MKSIFSSNSRKKKANLSVITSERSNNNVNKNIKQVSPDPDLSNHIQTLEQQRARSPTVSFEEASLSKSSSINSQAEDVVIEEEEKEVEEIDNKQPTSPPDKDSNVTHHHPKEESAYKIISGISVGGSATVIKIKDSSSKKVYAMKVILEKRKEKNKEIFDKPSSSSSSSSFSASSQHHEPHHYIDLELEAMKSFNSPFIVKCIDAFEYLSYVHFVLEYIDGGDLFFHMNHRVSITANKPKPKKSNNVSHNEDEGLFTSRELLILLAELFLALEHMHSHGFIHRDLKIENIMLDKNGHIKLIDFGTVFKLTPTSSSSSSSSLSASHNNMHSQQVLPRGSLIYLAPELLKDKIGGRHTDWWAYGIVAYELLTGCTPWSSLTNRKQNRI